MDRNRLFTCLCSFLLSFFLAISSVACLVTAFSLPTINWGILALICALAAAVCCFCFSGRLWLIPLGIFALVGGFLWQSGALENGVETLAYQVSAYYNAQYHIGIISWTGRNLFHLDVTLPVTVVAVLIVTLVSWCICRKANAIAAVTVAILPPALAAGVPSCLPNTLWLYLFLLTLVLLLLTQTTRRQDPAQGNRLTALAALPTALALWLLFACIPVGSIPSNALTQTFIDPIVSLEFWDKLAGRVQPPITMDGSQIDLSQLGVQRYTDIQIMDVRSETAQTLYLRSQSYNTYDKLRWGRSIHSCELAWPEEELLSHSGRVLISTQYQHRRMYVPYYAPHVMEGDMDALDNGQSMTVYSYDLMDLPADYWQLETDQDISCAGCTQLPSSTLAWAQLQLPKIVSDGSSVYNTAQAIARFVRSRAEYDLMAPAMHQDNGDFVRWFVTNGDKGYCVHFASSAVVLLRAAGIPARYVTGYLVPASQWLPLGSDGYIAPVTDANAHAWAEYYLPGVGWVALEATPSANSDYTEPTWEETKTPSPTADLSWLLPAIGILLITAGVCCLAAIRIRALLRWRKLTHGPVKQRILAYWQELTLLSGVLDQLPDAELLALAQEAKFSDHTMEESCLAPFRKAREQALAQLKKLPFFRRLALRIFRGVY